MARRSKAPKKFESIFGNSSAALTDGKVQVSVPAQSIAIFGVRLGNSD